MGGVQTPPSAGGGKSRGPAGCGLILCNVSYAKVMSLSSCFSLPMQYKAIIDTNCMCTALLPVGVY